MSVALLAGWSLAVSAWGQERGASTALEEVVVTSTRAELPRSRVPSSVTVITRETIEQSRVTDLFQLLRQVPGLSVSQPGGRGQVTSVFPRGGESDYTMVLIDGVKVNNAGGAFDFSDLSTDNIERIEIIRGPQSALYGSEAIGGIIHIITRPGKGSPRGELALSGGSFTTTEEKINLAGGWGGGGYSFGASRTDSQGRFTVNNDFSNTVLSGRLDLAATDQLGLTLTSRYTDNLFQVPTGGAGDRFDPLDPRQFRTRKRLVLGGKANWQPTSWWLQTLQLYQNREDQVSEDPLDPGIDSAFSRIKAIERRLGTDYLWHFLLPRHLGLTPTLDAGVNFEEETLDRTSIFGNSGDRVDRGRHNLAFYLQGQLDWRQQALLVVGLRAEHHSTFGSAANPRVTGSYQLPRVRTTVRGAYATGIKAPSFIDNFGTGSPFVIGNPDLRPERSRSWEFGLNQPFWGDALQVSATYFYSRFADLISFVGGSPNFMNIQAARSTGVELEVGVKPWPQFSLNLSYDFLETAVLDDGGVGGTLFPPGQPLLRRPKHKGAVQLSYEVDRLNLHLAGALVGDAIDRDFSQGSSPRVTLAGYPKIDLAAGYLLRKRDKRTPGMRLTARIENLLNYHYEEAFGFSSPRLGFLLGLSSQF